MSNFSIEKTQAEKLRLILKNEFNSSDGQELILLSNLFSHIILGTEVVKLQQLFNINKQSNRLSLRKLKSVLNLLEHLGFLKS